MTIRTPTRKPVVLGICAAGSNTGKTTLITQLIPLLAQRNIRTSVIKHAHHRFDIDHPGKDSYLIRESGAVQTLVASSQRWALMTELQRTPKPADAEIELDELLSTLNAEYADLILIEGFKFADIPKLEVHRPSLQRDLLAGNDPRIIAVATDQSFAEAPETATMLDLNDPSAITDFIMLKFFPDRFLPKS